MLFYDTCSLLKELHNAFKEKFFISNITLKELENIKTSMQKDEDAKYRARHIIHLLDEQEKQYEVVDFSLEFLKLLPESLLEDVNNDIKIIACALATQKKRHNITFITEDLCCKRLAASAGLKVKYINDKDLSNYNGFKELLLDTEEKIGNFYNNINSNKNLYNLLTNQYLILKDKNGEVIDKFIFNGKNLEQIKFNMFNSQQIGKVKPKDEYQLAAMDSLKRNQITLLRGPAGTGKSYLAVGYLFDLLEKGKIDKIIIFCNTVATAGSARLGFYPGTKDEKLLDSQIGNFLGSKLGGKEALMELISAEKIILLPLSDIRGYDTTNMHAGIYITEAQNLDIELMRLALQRVGEDSICILDGDDLAQVDMSIYAGNNNGLRRVSQIFRGQDYYGEITLQNIYRSKIAKQAQLM
jgi:predicted ribonuclease YlaK